MADAQYPEPEQSEEKDVFCPRCGYNLRAIPERRCPECGFGYDHAAIQAVALAEVREWDARYRKTIIQATLAIVLIIAPRLNFTSLLPPLRIVPMIVPFLLWGLLARSYSDPKPMRFFSGPAMYFLYLVGFVTLARLTAWSPFLAVAIATISTGAAWMTFIRDEPNLPAAPSVLSARDQRVLQARRVLAWVSLAVATLVVLFSWR